MDRKWEGDGEKEGGREVEKGTDSYNEIETHRLKRKTQRKRERQTEKEMYG